MDSYKIVFFRVADPRFEDPRLLVGEDGMKRRPEYTIKVRARIWGCVAVWICIYVQRDCALKTTTGDHAGLLLLLVFF